MILKYDIFIYFLGFNIIIILLLMSYLKFKV